MNNSVFPKINIVKKGELCSGIRYSFGRLKLYFLKNPTREFYILGNFVHNEEIIKEIEDMNIKKITIDDIKTLKEESVVFGTAHGVETDIIKRIESKNCFFVNLTCPFLIRLKKALALNDKNKTLIVGLKDHQEIKYLTDGNSSVVLPLDNLDESIPGLDPNQDYQIYSQSTLSPTTLNKTKDILNSNQIKYEDFTMSCHDLFVIFNSIAELNPIDLSIVVGSSKSNNAKELYSHAKHYIKDVAMINDTLNITKLYPLLDLHLNDGQINLIAATSTPTSQIIELKKQIKGYYNSKFSKIL